MASSTTLSLTPTNWYTAKVVVDDDPNDAALQRLRFWVDTDNDADFSDETAMIDTTLVDDDWSGGNIGLTTLTWDNNGNCTYDGVLTYTFDAWNRLRKSR